MNRRKPGLSIEQHRMIGLELARIADRLVSLCIEIGRAYPKNSRVYRLAIRPPSSGPGQVLDQLRSEMENHMFAEYPADSRANTSVYYPPAEMRREEAPAAKVERPWVVAMECGCTADSPGTIKRVHYVFGPFSSREQAEEFARSWSGRRDVHVFRLWPPRIVPTP
jgi:hypothetical protein